MCQKCKQCAAGEPDCPLAQNLRGAWDRLHEIDAEIKKHWALLREHDWRRLAES